MKIILNISKEVQINGDNFFFDDFFVDETDGNDGSNSSFGSDSATNRPK